MRGVNCHTSLTPRLHSETRRGYNIAWPRESLPIQNNNKEYMFVRSIELFITGCLAVTAIHAAPAGAVTGPTSSQSPYLLRSQPGVVTMSVRTTGDAVNFKADGVTPYRLGGIPDGLGAFDNGDGTFTLLVNHELGNAVGIIRDHGFKGAYVSKWIIEKETLTVLHWRRPRQERL